MNDLISRQAAINAVNCDITITGGQNAELVSATIRGFVDRIKALPSAQQEQTAEWVPSTKYKGFLTCSACEDCYIESWSDKERKWRYCPQCGNKMKEKGA